MHACSVTSVMSNSLKPYGLQPVRLIWPWDSPGKNTGMGCHSRPSGDLPNPGIQSRLLRLLHFRWILYCLSHREAQDPHYYSVIAWLQQGGKLATTLQSNRNCNFHKTKCQSLNIPCVCICISMYVCMHPVPPLHGKQMGKQWKQCQTLFLGAPKSLQMVTAAMKLKDTYSLEGKI